MLVTPTIALSLIALALPVRVENIAVLVALPGGSFLLLNDGCDVVLVDDGRGDDGLLDDDGLYRDRDGRGSGGLLGGYFAGLHELGGGLLHGLLELSGEGSSVSGGRDKPLLGGIRLSGAVGRGALDLVTDREDNLGVREPSAIRRKATSASLLQVDLGGLIPKSLVNAQAIKQLVHLSTMRKRFDRSLEIDGKVRAQNVALIAGHADEYSLEERFQLNGGVLLFEKFGVLNAKTLQMVSPFTTAKIAYKSGDSHAWGWAKTTVRASPTEILAFVSDTMKRSALQEDDLEKSVDERANGHDQLVYQMKRTPAIIADRDFLGFYLWKKEGDGFIFVTSPQESDARPITDGVVRGKFLSVMRFKRKNDQETTVDYVIHPDFGGPGGFAYFMNLYTASNLSYVTAIQEYFQELRGLEEWDANDARAVGEVLCIKTRAEKHNEKGESKVRARVRELFKKQKALKQIGRKYSFFQSMITRVIENKLRTAGDVKSKLCSVSAKEGREIGAGLALSLATNLTAEAGVDDWILKHCSLGELDKTEAWFR